MLAGAWAERTFGHTVPPRETVTTFERRGHTLHWMRGFLCLVLVACGGHVSPDPDSGGVPDSAPSMLDAQPPTFDDGGLVDVDMPQQMPTPPGSILALARGPNQNDYLTVVRIDLPNAVVTPLWTFQLPVGQ